jgi:hypothetical protein
MKYLYLLSVSYLTPLYVQADGQSVKHTSNLSIQIGRWTVYKVNDPLLSFYGCC